MNVLKNKKSIRVALLMLSFLFVAIYFGTRQEKEVTPSNKQITGGVARIKRITISPNTESRAQQLLASAPEKSVRSEEAMTYLRDLMTDPAFSTFFNFTLDFFGDSPAAYPAARFVGLTLLFDSSPENFYLRTWTQKEIEESSEEIMKTIEAKADQIDVNPYFHSRMLNLVHQLDIPADRKLNFYSKTLEKPLEINDQGELHDYSLAFETALILSKQSKISSGDFGAVISRAIIANANDPQKMESLKVRVVTYYPELRYLFTN
jgi:hypothetical protein